MNHWYKPELIQRAKDLHKRNPLIDGHNDLPWKYRQRTDYQFSVLDMATLQPGVHADIPKLREGGVGGQFWSVYVSTDLNPDEYVRATIEQIDFVYKMVERYPDSFEIALTADDVESIFEKGKIASLIGVEGGHSIDCSIPTLRMLFRLGARYMTLTHDKNVPWADSCSDILQSRGLSQFGREVVYEMNRLGMLVDLSHVSPDTMRDTLDVAQAPVIFSHSSARSLNDHPRNVPDDVLKRMPLNGGVVMANFVTSFISPEVYDHFLRRKDQIRKLRSLSKDDHEIKETDVKSTDLNMIYNIEKELETWDKANPAPQATLMQVADHIDRIVDMASIDNVGIGSDFDGITKTPIGLEDASKFPMLTAELINRGYSDGDIGQILGRNVLRVMREAEEIAVKAKKKGASSDAAFRQFRDSRIKEFLD